MNLQTDGQSDSTPGGRRGLLHPAPSLTRASDHEGERSRSPRHSDHETPQQTNTAAENDSMITKELGQYISPEVRRNLGVQIKKLRKGIDSLQGARKKLETVNNDLVKLNNGELPQSIRANSVLFESHILDQEKAEDHVLTIEIRSSMTLREAKRHIHLKANEFQRAYDKKVLEKYVSSLKGQVKQSSFTAACMQSFSVRSPYDKLGIDDENAVAEEGLDEAHYAAKLGAIYRKCLDKALAKVEEDERKAKSEQQNKAAVVKALKAKKPMEHLDAAIDRRIEQQLKKGKHLEKKGGDSFKVDESAIAYELLTQNVDENMIDSKVEVVCPKSKAKAKSKAKPKQNGGPKSASKKVGAGTSNPIPDKGKGKGKGKDKGKTRGSIPYARPKNGQPSWKTQGGQAKGDKGKGKSKDAGRKGKGKGSERGGKGKGKSAENQWRSNHWTYF